MYCVDVLKVKHFYVSELFLFALELDILKMLMFISLTLFSNKYLLSTYYSLPGVGEGGFQFSQSLP